MRNIPKIRIFLAGIVLFASIGATHYALNGRSLPMPPNESVVSAAAKPDKPAATGVVAGVSTATIEAPEGVEVVVSPATSTPKRLAPTGTNTPKQPTPPAADVLAPNPIPEPAPEPTPETIIVNLKTPLTYTLRPGERSPALEHLMIDGKQYEWRSGQAAFWQDETPDPALPVWVTIQLDKPVGPYISDRLPFVIQAAAHAAPGTYDTKVSITLRDGVVLGVPVAVTVIDSKAD